MEFETLKQKTVTNGKIDLLSTYVKFDYDKIIIKDYVIIDEGSNTSIDLVSTIAYGRPDYLDLLIKFNRLNNPLYIPTGTIIMIPEFNSLIANTEYVDLSKVKVSILAKQSNGFEKLKSASPGTKAFAASNYVKTSSGSYVF